MCIFLVCYLNKLRSNICVTERDREREGQITDNEHKPHAVTKAMMLEQSGQQSYVMATRYSYVYKFLINITVTNRNSRQLVIFHHSGTGGTGERKISQRIW